MKMHFFTYRYEEQIVIAAPDDMPLADVRALVLSQEKRLFEPVLSVNSYIISDGSEMGLPEDVKRDTWIVADTRTHILEGEDTEWLLKEIG